MGRSKRLHDRRCVHDVERESESEHHLYGVDGEGGCLRGWPDEAAGAVGRGMRTVSLAVLIGFGAAGCLHRSPEERILAAFEDYGGEWFQAEKPAPEYLSFRDKLSAWVFRDVMRNGRFRVAPRGEALFCPG